MSIAIEELRKKRIIRSQKARRMWQNPVYRSKRGVGPFHRQTKSINGKYIARRCAVHPRADAYGYVLEHILIWESARGRPVPKGFIIHHINGIGTDNRVENLEAISNSQHSAFHYWLRENNREPSKIALEEWRK